MRGRRRGENPNKREKKGGRKKKKGISRGGGVLRNIGGNFPRKESKCFGETREKLSHMFSGGRR